MPRSLRRWSVLKSLPATLETIRASLPNDTPLELWWQDEARVGQKNTIARRWARRGTRPHAPHDQRTSSAHIFGAICPQQGKGAALVLPRCDTPAMNLHLAEVAQAVAPGAHGVLLMDRAGWHRAKDLVVPNNLRVCPGSFCYVRELSEHTANGSQVQEGESLAAEALPVLGQPTAAVQPSLWCVRQSSASAGPRSPWPDRTA